MAVPKKVDFYNLLEYSGLRFCGFVACLRRRCGIGVESVECVPKSEEVTSIPQSADECFSAFYRLTVQRKSVTLRLYNKYNRKSERYDLVFYDSHENRYCGSSRS